MINLLYFMAKYSRRMVVFAIIAGVISGICNTALLATINKALHSLSSVSLAIVVTFAGLCILLPLARYVSEILLTDLGQNALFDLRVKMGRKILEAPLRQLEELGHHRLLAALTDDVPAITNALLNIPIICINIAVVLGGLSYLGWLSVAMLLAVLGFMVLGIMSYQLPILRAMRYFKMGRESADSLMRDFQALTHGIKELKLHKRRRDAFISESLRANGDALRRNNIKGMSIHTATASWGQVLVFVVVGLTIFIGPEIGHRDSQSLTGYTLVLLYLMTPLQVLMNVLPAMSRASIAIRKVEDLGVSLITEFDHPGPAHEPASQPTSWEKMELINLTHAYKSENEDHNFTLGPINLTIARGELIFLTGGNGSGKTTLAKLITGLYTPEGGEIRIDGKQISAESKDAYRECFSVVFSDFYLFDKLYGLETPDLDQRAHDHLVQFSLDQKVKISDGALSTTDLSQGQRKRLALLTAYLEDRPIYLFDEWAADQDPMFRDIFYYQLLPSLKAKGKTLIVISHDDRYYHLGDRIIKMEYGKLVDGSNSADPERLVSEVVAP